MQKLIKVKLLQNIEKLGRKGDVVDVKRGYARNYLIPTQKVEKASSARHCESVTELISSTVKSLREGLNEVCFIVKAKVGPSGKLFGSISLLNIKMALKDVFEENVDIRLDQSIKGLGAYFVEVRIQDVKGWIKMIVVSEN